MKLKPLLSHMLESSNAFHADAVVIGSRIELTDIKDDVDEELLKHIVKERSMILTFHGSDVKAYITAQRYRRENVQFIKQTIIEKFRDQKIRIKGSEHDSLPFDTKPMYDFKSKEIIFKIFTRYTSTYADATVKFYIKLNPPTVLEDPPTQHLISLE